MKSQTLLVQSIASIALALLLACGGPASPEPDLSSETHWMLQCLDGEVCGQGGQCVCGVCTLPCADALDCEDAGPLTRCVPSGTEAVDLVCGDAPPAQGGICLAPCQGEDACGHIESDLSCQDAHCVPEPGLEVCRSHAACGERRLCLIEELGACLNPLTPGVCAERPEACIEIFAPVCGCDGNTYDNACFAQANGVNVAAEGECELDCATIFAPVCGVDGNTYPNECEAGRAGVEVDHEGECNEGVGDECTDDRECRARQFCRFPAGTCGNDTTGICTTIPEACIQIFAPVCGCDGNTYSNECVANEQSQSVAQTGECE